MQRFINNWETVLLQPLGAAGQTLQLDPAAASRLIGLGSGDFYLLTLCTLDSLGNETAWEVVRAMSVEGGAVAVSRAWEGEALDLVAGSIVSARVTAASLTQLVATIQEQAQAISSLTGALDAQEEAIGALAARVAALESGGEQPANVLTNQAGDVLTDQAGEPLTAGAQV
ncbi:hypothetical protein BWR15_06230 [Pseudomonas sp. T]|nr:hypothetical protein BWR15_06230 [Pseudomonas sp. T]